MATEKPARPGNRKEFVRTRVPAAELAAQFRDALPA